MSAHIGSGILVLKDGDQISVALNSFTIHFVPWETEGSKSADFVVTVPFNKGQLKVSKQESVIERDGQKYRLLVVMLGADSRGQVVSATYTIAQVD